MIKLNQLILEEKLWYIGRNPAAGVILVKKFDIQYKVLLILGFSDSYWRIPGGFQDTDATKGERFKEGKETLTQAAIREIKEELNLDISQFEKNLIPINVPNLYEIYSSWVDRTEFILLLPKDFDVSSIRAGDDAKDARWFNINELKNLLVAFDYKETIFKGLKKIL